LVSRFKDTPLLSFTRGMLQDFLDELANTPMVSDRARDHGRLRSRSVIAHVRFDLRMIFDYAFEERLIDRNPATILAIPDAPRPEQRILTLEEATTLFNSFPLRERLILKLCGLLGMRPGEAFGLQWQDLHKDAFRINRRIYRGKPGTPKTTKSIRLAALSDSVTEDLEEWRSVAPRTGPHDWVFASENPKTPLWPTNVWYDKIRPTLKKLGMPWVNYQVLRRSTASLLNALGVDGQVVASQLGHGLDVSQNVYNKVAVARQRQAVNKLDRAINRAKKNTKKESAA